MAGYTNWTITVGGPAVEPDRVGPVEAAVEAAATKGTDVDDFDGSDGPDAPGAWRTWTLHTASSHFYESDVRPHLDELAGDGAYWRVWTDARDDFDASWFDSLGETGTDPSVDDIVDGAWREPLHEVRLTAAELELLAHRIATRIDADIDDDDADVLAAIEAKVARAR